MTQLIGTSAAAELLGVHRATVWRLVRSGELPAQLVERGGAIFDRDDVIALRDRRAQQLDEAS